MRELARIDRIMSLITKIWCKYPDLRFNQLIFHLQTKYEGGKYIQKVPTDERGWGMIDVPDLFNVEDDKFEKFLSDYYMNLKVV
jgi:hypothetical protein